MIINVGGTGLPVRGLAFPAVTVCQDEQDDTIDRWYFIETILNVIDIECDQIDSKFIVV
jgi:hypothetical protein